MAHDSGPEESIIAEINLTPLVDVSLVLVIIFMVVAPLFSTMLKSLPLPAARQAALTEANTINVSLFSDGTVAVGPREVRAERLRPELVKLIAAGRPPWVVVRAGADVPYGRVMDVLDRVESSGIKRIGFATRRGGRRDRGPDR